MTAYGEFVPEQDPPDEGSYGPETATLTRLAEAAFRTHFPQLQKHFPNRWVAHHGTQCIDIAVFCTELCDVCVHEHRLQQDEVRFHQIACLRPAVFDPPLTAEELSQIPPLSSEDIRRLRIRLHRRDPIARLADLVRKGLRLLW